MISLAQEDLKRYVRNIPDFPKKGIMFRDITTLLKDKTAFKATVDILYEKYAKSEIEKVAAVEARGFITGAALADRLGAGFVLLRKPGKLPSETLRENYKLEYGEDGIEIHKDAITLGERILLHDDLLATGGTISAACNLVEKAGGSIVGVSFLIELAFLHGRVRLPGQNIFSIMQYDSE